LSGSDRIYEAYFNNLKDDVDLIINLQGDMPNIKPDSIAKLEQLMRKNNCDIGTLSSHILNKQDINNPNIVKVKTKQMLKNDSFFEAKDFFRIKKDLNNDKIYHHIGIYAFTNIALTKYVKLDRSRLEIERNLEQMRAMENNLGIKVGLCDSATLGVDVEEDLIKEEVILAKRLFLKNKWPIIDVTRKSIEETAAAALEYLREFKERKKSEE
jgi:3-deoxy-manno-octulosonate cytidylyltransferase (CMP-KDO synthetase)